MSGIKSYFLARAICRRQIPQVTKILCLLKSISNKIHCYLKNKIFCIKEEPYGSFNYPLNHLFLIITSELQIITVTNNRVQDSFSLFFYIIRTKTNLQEKFVPC